MVYTRLAETCKKADTTNEDEIRFILRNIKIDRKIFENYRYYLYKDLPWYIRELFMEEYGIQKEWCPYNIHYHYKNVLVGESNMYFGQFLDNINTIDKQPKGKK